MPTTDAFARLATQLDGELHYDELWRLLYATDGSVYRKRPLAVALPGTMADLHRLVGFAREHGLPLIPRAAGTSLAGQVVGEGIIVDAGRHLNQILELNADEGWVCVQPGVIRDELNAFLRPHGLFFGPNTSTANRCMMGGMVGNNSCGTTSITYGSTRDQVRELRCILSDGSEVTFGPVDAATFHAKRRQDDLEGRLYQQLYEELNDPARQARIRAEYPKPLIHRRNTGYAIDLLLRSEIFTPGGPPFNMCTLLCGSEGTLALTTEIRLALSPLPEPAVVVVAAHFRELNESMEAVLTAMAHQPTACELMDDTILELTKGNREQQRNRFFVQGDPRTLLLVEFRGATPAIAQAKAEQLIKDLRQNGQGYAYPIVEGADTARVWALRSAGLGVLANLPGDGKAVACIEDTAVDIQDLPAYIRDFAAMMEQYEQRPVYYAHAGAGEIHLRPILNLKTAQGQQDLHDITRDVAHLVKKYRGSLSGEHGDGRVRAPFLPLMVGEDNYQLLRRIKQSWDPQGIFNPGKIIDAPPLTEDLRYTAGQDTPPYNTALDLTAEGGLLRLAEKCNGSGDCRKLALSGGTMCPSYRATRQEKDTTRGRANALREILTQNAREDPCQHPALAEAMDLCLSCKGCTAECPSNVDMASLKAEYLYQRYREKGFPWRHRLFARIDEINAIGSWWPGLTNFFLRNPLLSRPLKRLLGVATERSLPPLNAQPLHRWWRRVGRHLPVRGPEKGMVYFFADEFTRYNDADIGREAIRLLLRLGYRVKLVPHANSGRAAISKGMLHLARAAAEENVQRFAPLVTADTPLLGVEPSAILGFRDEYPRLLRGQAQERARQLAPHTLLVEEFLAREVRAGRLDAQAFDDQVRHIILHGHCHQKALAEVSDTAFLLGLPTGHTVTVLPTGCCGMAGSFGYEAEHYAVSMAVGETTLFPALRQTPEGALIAAPGTSCRHQILDGTGRAARHPLSILFEALNEC
ncbi:MAG: FAD-binding protein [Lewinella sp.]|nr:FAD-binding protein [Lewinella sp.]